MKGSRAFFDSSAIIPVLLQQASSTQARQLLRKYQKPVLAWTTPIEVQSALSRLSREGYLNDKGYRAAIDRFASIEDNKLEVLPTAKLRELAKEILQHYDLRAADAIQLASALLWCNEKPKDKPFISFDARLADAAAKAGFAVHAAK
jgi:uncharacterized protein